MRRTLRPTDWGALLTLAFSLLIIAPMLFTAGIPRSNDNEHWVFQTANVAQALGEGRLYPRWSPHTLGGYGAPIPHYYPPLPAYSAGLLETVFTGQSVEAVRLIYLLSIAFAGLPVYAIAARHSNARAGLIAALLYVGSPYINFVTPVQLGDLPAAVSHLLLPFLLWAFDRLMTINSPYDLPLATLATTALILTDLRHLLVAVLLLSTLLVWHLRRGRSAGILPAVTCIGVGIALAAFFWLPALLEYDAVQWRVFTDPPPNHIALRSIFQTLTQLDPADAILTAQFTMGAAIPVLTAISIFAQLRRAGFRQEVLWLCLGSVCLTLALVLRAGWLLGSAALCLSLGAGASAHVVEYLRPRLRPFAVGLLAALIMLSALPIWLTPRPTETSMDSSGAAQIQYEQQGFGIAGLPAGWRLPTTLAAETAFNPWLIASYSTGEIEKIDPQSIPSGVQIGFLDHESHGDRLQIQSDFSNTIAILTAAFPGWVAYATSAEITLERAPDSGLLNLTFPNGVNSDITIALGSTPPRALGWAISGLTAAMLILLTTRRRRNPTDDLASFELITRGDALGITTVWAVFAMIILVSLTGGLQELRAVPGSGLANSNPLRITTDAGLEVIAYREARNGPNVEITLYWRALTALDRNLRSQITLVDPTTGRVVTQSPIQHPGGFPTRRWASTRYVTDFHRFILPESAQTTPVAARVEVYDCSTVCTPDNRITFFDTQGLAIGQTLTLPIAS